MSGLADSTPVGSDGGGGGDDGDHAESDHAESVRSSTNSESGLRFAGKRQVVIQNLDLSPLRLDDPPRHHVTSSSTTNPPPAQKSMRVRLPPLTNIGDTPSSDSSVLRHERGSTNKTNDRMSTGPVDLAAA